MSVTDEAKVKLGVDGADEATRKVNEYRQAWASLGELLTNPPSLKGWDKLADQVGGRLKDTVGGAAATVVRLGLGVKTLSFDEAIKRADDFDRSVTRMAIATGRSIDDLKGKYRTLGKENLLPAGKVEELTKTFGKATYDIRGAEEALSGLHKEALATGRSDEEMQPLYQTLHDLFGVTGKSEGALGKLRAQAEALGQGGAGGVQKLQDLYVSMADSIQMVSDKTAGAREQTMAFVATVTKGMTQAQASRVGAGIVGGLQGHAVDLQRTLRGLGGKDLFDDEGHLKDPMGALRELDQKMKRRGMSESSRKWAFRSDFGMEAGSVLYAAMRRGDDKKVKELMGVAPSAGAEGALVQLRESGAGKREAARLATEGAQVQAAENTVLPAQSGAAGLVAQHPWLALAGATAGPALAKWGLGGLAKRLGVRVLTSDAAARLGGATLLGKGAIMSTVGSAALGAAGGAAVGAGMEAYSAYRDEKNFEDNAPRAGASGALIGGMVGLLPPGGQPPPQGPDLASALDNIGMNQQTVKGLAAAIGEELRRSPLAVAPVQTQGAPEPPRPQARQ